MAKRGSGSKENVGRHTLPYKTKRLNKTVPADIYDLCLSLVDSELLKFKNKMKSNGGRKKNNN